MKGKPIHKGLEKLFWIMF